MQAYLQSFAVLTAAEITWLMGQAVPRTLKKGDFFIAEGKVCDEVAFIEQGILHSYYTDKNGDTFTYCLTFPGQFMTAYSSYITELPSLENIQAISNVDLLVVKKTAIAQLAASSINGLRLLKIIAEQQYLNLEKRVFMYQKDHAKARYLALFESYPAYVKQIPVKYLASFLAITPRHLSRLRKEVI